jgi:hypothetical protein
MTASGAQPSSPGSEADRFWELAIAVNAAFKGLLGSMGESGHVCARVLPVVAEIDLRPDWPAVIETLAELAAPLAVSGDTIVVPDKIVAVAQGRIGPGRILREPDPKQIDPARLSELARIYAGELGFPIEPLHLLLADEYDRDQASLGALDHNLAAAELARAIYRAGGALVDVIVSDTDTGLDVRTPLIGCVTIAATPLGATAGINLYGAMRCATAAEFVRGHTRRIPIVICQPAERCRDRDGIGQHRGYDGALHIEREKSITYF